MRKIKEMIEEDIESFGKIGHPAFLSRFVLEKGQEFNFNPWTGKKGEPNNCYQNAAQEVMNEPYKYEYVEGYAYHKERGFMLFQHAWLYDPKERVAYDSTLKFDEYLYFGVRIPSWRMAEELARTGYYGLFADGSGRQNVELFGRMSRKFSKKKLTELVDEMQKNRAVYQSVIEGMSK
jgi:hypothetical protein